MKFGRPFWITIAVLLIATAIYYPFSPGGAQRWNMKRAERHIETLKPLIANDPRFSEIKLMPFTGSGGSLAVVGRVATSSDQEALRAIVMSSNPPTEVRFVTHVEPTTISASQPSK